MTKTLIKKILSSLAFDPKSAPHKFIIETRNPGYAIARAKETLYEVQNTENLILEIDKMKTTIQLLTTAIGMLENGTPKDKKSS